MNLPDHLTDLIRGLLESDKSDPGMVYLTAAALADELRDWVGNPAGYVPREVLAGLLRDLGENLRQQSESRFPIATMEQWRTLKQRLGEVNAGQCPAWFVVADWDRMTDEEKDAARQWVRRNAGQLEMWFGNMQSPDAPDGVWFGLAPDMTADMTNWEAPELSAADVARMQEFERQVQPVEFQITGHWSPAADVQAAREAFVRERIDVPDGWRFEWIPSPTRGEPPYVYGHGHDDGDSWFLMLAEMTYTLEPGMPGSTPWPETYRSYVGRCERCRTVYATRPEMVRPAFEPVTLTARTIPLNAPIPPELLVGPSLVGYTADNETDDDSDIDLDDDPA